jgi:16S rRNA (uracil1498-N3)-methyltransferase
MRSYRVYSSRPLTVDEQCDLDDRASRHLARVLRVKPGERLSVFNGDGNNYQGAIVSASKHQVSVLIDGIEPAETESSLNTCLALAVSKGDRFEWAIKKATELGVTTFVPILSQRVDVRLSPERWQKKQEHWQQIVISACEQSGRAVVPKVKEPTTLSQWLSCVEADCKLVLDPEAAPSALHDQPASIALLTGPEGGLARSELTLASENGFSAMQLGPRVLRTETAPLVALSVLGARWGDINA